MPHALVAAVALVVALASTPAAAAPCAGFTDVEDTSPFCVNVAWMRNRGITLGCTATLYCPNDFVTRLQMAAFMYRLGFQNAYLQGGNAFAATAVVGTTDNFAVELRANNARVMRYEPNTTSPNVIGGSPANNVTAGMRGATIAGGGVRAGDSDPDFAFEAPNRVTDVYGTVGGGFANRAWDDAGTATDNPFATVGGGSGNTASGAASTVGGGDRNSANSSASTVGRLQQLRERPCQHDRRRLQQRSERHLQHGRRRLHQHRERPLHTVPGGQSNEATADFSFAAGRRAKSDTTGSFTWADSTDLDFGPSVANFFAVRATGGAGITVAVNPTTGASTQFCNYLPGTMGWSCVSDREQKENLSPADGAAVLERLAAMPVYTYNFKGSPATLRMLGPTAQDFRAAFALGDSELTIASGNIDGVALAAIQGLNAKLEAKLAEHARSRNCAAWSSRWPPRDSRAGRVGWRAPCPTPASRSTRSPSPRCCCYRRRGASSRSRSSSPHTASRS